MDFTNSNRRNAMKYIPSVWNKKDSPAQRKRQEIIVNETLNLICNNILKNGITFDFMGETYKMDCFQKEDFKGLKVVFKDIQGAGIYAEYSAKDRTIYLDETLRADGLRCFASLYHEATHMAQNIQAKYIDEFQGGSPIYNFLTLISSEIKPNKRIDINSFGFNFNSPMYITGNNAMKVNKYFGFSLYMIQASERIAKTVELEAYNYVSSLSNRSNKKDLFNVCEEDFQISSNFLKDFLDTTLSFDELCKKNDAARLCIINQTSPPANDDITATLMYYIIAELKFEKMWDVGDLAFLEEQFRKIMDTSALKEALKNGYPEENKYFVGPNYAERINGVPYVNDLFVRGEEYNAFYLVEMTKEEQQRNPLIIANAIILDGSKVHNELFALKSGFLVKEDSELIIKDLKAFETWYNSPLNNLDKYTMDSISKILDRALGLNPPRFSYDAYIKNQQATKHKETITVEPSKEDQVVKGESYCLGAPWEPKHMNRGHKNKQNIDINR